MVLSRPPVPNVTFAHFIIASLLTALISYSSLSVIQRISELKGGETPSLGKSGSDVMRQFDVT